MSRHLEGLDHCVVIVRDLDQAANAYARLGFRVAPHGDHGPEMGTGNRVVLLENDYFELLGVLRPTAFSEEISHLASVREGIAAIALRTNDAEGAVRAAGAAGVAAGPTRSVQRQVKLPDGLEGLADFTIAYFTEVTTPFLRLFCSQIHTPELTWVPSLMRHPNTAWGIGHVEILVDRPEAAALEVAHILGIKPEAVCANIFSVPTGGAPFLFVTREALASTYPGVDLSSVVPSGPCVLTLKVSDAAVAAAFLTAQGVAFTATEAGLVVSPPEACGILLVLCEAARS